MELIKVMTGIPCCGKPVILELTDSGGMPWLADIRFEDEPSKQHSHALFNAVQLKDIAKRN